MNHLRLRRCHLCGKRVHKRKKILGLSQIQGCGNCVHFRTGTLKGIEIG